MGGVGVAGAKDDILGVLYHNPAGLMALDGHHAAFSMELFKPDRTLEATAPTQQGPFTGSQQSKSDWVPIIPSWLPRPKVDSGTCSATFRS
jgi:long-subunit fatty acid transport protein